MEIFQGTISNDYKCRPFVKNEKPIGLLFYKKTHAQEDAIVYFLLFFAISMSIVIWYKFSFGAFLFALCLSFGCLATYTIIDKKKSEQKGIKYLIKEIKEVKVIDNDTMSSFAKSGANSLTGAAVGGLLFGGAGAVVGSIASGNKNLKEQIVRVGVKFEDENWVVLQAEINETIMGKVNKANLKLLLEMTSSKQLAPF